MRTNLPSWSLVLTTRQRIIHFQTCHHVCLGDLWLQVSYQSPSRFNSDIADAFPKFVGNRVVGETDRYYLVHLERQLLIIY